MKKLRIAMVPTVLVLLVVVRMQQRELALYDRYVAELHTYTATIENRIPTFREIQEKLAAAGYEPGPIDGKIGIRTLAAWDRAICDQYAVVWFKEISDDNSQVR
jgi:hypothetical protein